MKLKLTLEVEYKENSTPVNELKQILKDMIAKSFNEGGFTDTTDAEVNSCNFKVEEVKEPEQGLRKKKVTLCDGKYELFHNEVTGKLYAYRNGQTWRSCLGDNLVLSLFNKIESLNGLD